MVGWVVFDSGRPSVEWAGVYEYGAGVNNSPKGQKMFGRQAPRCPDVWWDVGCRRCCWFRVGRERAFVAGV
eukprot:1388371-Pyramimonas_sp.AAC.1